MTADVRNEREVARPLDRRRQLALVPRAGSAQAARENLPLIGDESAERAVVLVIDEADPSFAERAAFLWSSHGLILVVVVIVAAGRGGELFLGHLRSAHLVFVEWDEVADDAVIELERSLVLGKHCRLGVKAGDDVVAVLARANGVGELAPSPMRHFRLRGGAEQSIEAVDLVGYGGVFEGGVEDVYRLVCASHL